MKSYRVFASVTLLVFLLSAVPAAFAADGEVIGLWQYREIVTEEGSASAEPGLADEQGVLLSNLQAMPLDLLGKVFGKIAYTAEFSGDRRFAIEIAVLYLRFRAQGEWSAEDGRMTLTYDEITGFERLWWLGSFDYLTHCDTGHTMTETVPYAVSDDTLTFFSNGARLVFSR